MLPRITPYAPPTADEVPPSRVDWTPDPARCVLLVHDMQHHFVDAFDTDKEPIPTVVRNVNALRDHCAASGVPVVFTAQPGGQSAAERGLLKDVWGDGVPADPRAERVIEPLTPRDGEVVLRKWRYSAFVGTGLADLLAGRDQLVITGVYGHIGVLTTALDAFCRDIQPFVVADAIADFDAERHRWVLDYVAGRCGRVVTTADLTAALGADRRPFTVAEIQADIGAILGEPVGEDDNLIDAGLDSIRLMTLVEKWRRAGREVSLMDLADNPTPRGFADVLNRG